MKVRSLCTLSLVAILGASLAGGISASAAPGDLQSEGKVKVVEGGETGQGKTPDPEKPDEKLPDHTEISTNPDAGALMMDQVSKLDFGTLKTSSKTVESYAKAIDLGEKGTRGAIIGWTDIRAGGVFGYTITAELTKQFTGAATAATELTSSTIDYSNGMAVPDFENENTVPSKTESVFQLAFGGGSKTVVTADKNAKEGKGTYAMEFGQSAAYTGGGAPGTDASSVKLTVPSATASNMAVDTYTATVTWKIVAE